MCKRHLNKSVTRRDILRYTLAGTGLAALGPLAGKIPIATGAPLSNHKRLLSLFCYGGYDGLNLLIPTSNSAYYSRRTAPVDISIPEASAIDIGEDPDYRLHPALVNIGQMYVNGEAAVFRKVGYPNANLSHFISQDTHSWGIRGDFSAVGISQSGWIARFADNYATTPMGVASIGLGRPLDFEGGSTNPFMTSRLQNFKIDDYSISDGDHEHRLQAIKDVLASFSGDTLTTEAKNALDQGHQLTDQIQMALADYDANSAFGALYPTSSPGRYIRDAAVLIRGGFETKIMMTGFGGWDTHGNQGGATGNQATLMTRMDQALGVFRDECIDMGVWDDMIVLISSEFGRRNFVNGSGGTDHGHGNFFFALGGAVNGGILYGPAVTESDVADSNWMGYGLDYRDIFKEAVGDHFGEVVTPVFPEAQDINTTLSYVKTA
jgi:uncharacterized protein (DUF1501 family)